MKTLAKPKPKPAPFFDGWTLAMKMPIANRFTPELGSRPLTDQEIRFLDLANDLGAEEATRRLASPGLPRVAWNLLTR